MANILERRDKNGKLVSFQIRVFRGRDASGKQLKPWTETFEVKPTWKEDAARRKAQAFADQFEKDCREGRVGDSRQSLSEYCDYVIKLREERGNLKHSTAIRYQELTGRIFSAIGNLKLKDIQTRHLNDFYTALSKEPSKVNSSCASKIDLAQVLKEKHLSRAKLARETGLGETTVSSAVAGKSVSDVTAQKICKALNMKLEAVFDINNEETLLSAKTVLEHHRLIHTVLQQAVKEKLIPYNPAEAAELPKAEKKLAQYFTPEEVNSIRTALDDEPIKWQVLVKLFLITGARRGEILGLRWKDVDLEQQQIHICNNILYATDRGVYEDTLKTTASDRYIFIPEETALMLRQYKAAQAEEKLQKGSYYQDQGFVFTRENGLPLHPDSVTDWMNKFSIRHNLPHIHPHAFRHTMASLLFYKHADPISISHRLGHAKVSTTSDMYSHVIPEADKRNADILNSFFA